MNPDLTDTIRTKTKPAAELLAKIDHLRNEIVQLKEDYRLANLRVIEVLEEKLEVERRNNELTIAVSRKNDEIDHWRAIAADYKDKYEQALGGVVKA